MAGPLVLLPPMLCDARVFAPQMTVLGREMAVTVAPVAGAARVEEIASGLLDMLPARFALAGMGFGGVVALEIARRAEKRVSRLALIAASPLPCSPGEASAIEPRIIAARMGRMDDVIAQELPHDALFAGEWRGEVMALVADMAAGNGAEAYVRQARAMQRRRDQQAVLRKLSQPVMVMGGAEDGLLPVRRHEFTAELIGRDDPVLIEEAGHLPTLENPDAVTDALRRWLGAPLVLR